MTNNANAPVWNAWRDAVNAFVRHLESSDLAPSTRAQQLKHVNRLARTAPTGPWELEHDQLVTWLDNHNWSSASRRNVVASLRTFYDWGVSTGFIDHSPVAVPAEPTLWPSVLADFADYLDSLGKAPARRTEYAKHVRMLAAIAPTSPWDVKAQQLAAWLDGRNWAHQTRAAVLVSLRAFYEWGVARGFIEESPTGRTALPSSWRDAIDGFAAHLENRELAPSTRSEYVRRVTWLAQVAPTDPWDLKPSQLGAWLDERKWSSATRHTVLGSVRAFYDWGVAAGRIEESPAARAALPSGWRTALTDFDNHLERVGLAPATRSGYVKHVTWLAETAPADPWKLNAHQMAAWLDDHNWSAQTRRKVLVSLRSFYAWAVASNFLEWAPTAGVPSAEPRKRGPGVRLLPLAWRAPHADYVDTLRGAAKSPGTIEQYTFRIRLLSDIAADPWAVTRQQLAQWLSNPDWSPQTKRCSLVAVASFYRWAVQAGHLESSPAEGLNVIKVPRALPRPAPEAALRTALAAADDRLRLMLMLAAYAGLRRAEIAGLHSSEISETHLMVVGKGGHHRMVPLDPEGDLAAELRAELARRRDGRCGSGWASTGAPEMGWLFPSDRPDGGHLTPGHVGRLVSAALPGVWSTHTLRHKFASTAYASTRDLRAVQELLGHARPETTSRYAAVPDGALLAAVTGAAGRR